MPTKKSRGESEVEDEETESFIRMMATQAEYRGGPRETQAAGDTLARRYFRSRTWRADGQGQQSQQQQAAMVLPVPDDYICHMCGESGHHIRACPKRQQRKHSKKIRPATGIPRSWLHPISADDVSLYDAIFCLPSEYSAAAVETLRACVLACKETSLYSAYSLIIERREHIASVAHVSMCVCACMYRLACVGLYAATWSPGCQAEPLPISS